jgi:tripartite-type tricarboxylate transporter receptor subunit TctC
MKKRISVHFAAMLVVILGMAATLIEAADYPTRAVTVINPYAPGGTLDIQARAFAMVAEKMLKQPVVVVNKAGATGMIGATEGAKAAPDGYTLTVGSTSTVLPVAWEIVNGRPPSVTIQDFVAIGSFTLSPTLVAIPHNSPWKTLADMVKDCKVKPDHFAFGSGGLYGGSHIPVELLMRAAGFRARHVPYKGGGPAVAAIVGGHVDFGCQFPPTCIPLYRGNKMRILAVQSNRRLKSIPEIPTIKELGLDAEFYQWVGIWAPKGMPADLVKKLREVTAAAVKEQAFIDAVEKPGDEVIFMNGEELARYTEKEFDRFSKLLMEIKDRK